MTPCCNCSLNVAVFISFILKKILLKAAPKIFPSTQSPADVSKEQFLLSIFVTRRCSLETGTEMIFEGTTLKFQSLLSLSESTQQGGGKEFPCVPNSMAVTIVMRSYFQWNLFLIYHFATNRCGQPLFQRQQLRQVGLAETPNFCI